MTSLVEQQLQIEQDSINTGMDRLREQLANDSAKMRGADNPVGQAQVTRLLDRTIGVVHKMQLNAKKAVREGMTTGRRLAGWELPVCMMDAEEMAFIALRTLCNHGLCIEDESPETRIAENIGAMCNLQVQFHQLKAGEADRLKGDAPSPAYNRLNAMRQQVKNINPRSVKQWLRKMDDIVTDRWDRKVRSMVGYQLIEVVVEECPDIFERENVIRNEVRGIREMVMIQFTDHAKKVLENRLNGMGMNMPWMLPMVCQPKPWSADELGGYLRIKEEFVKSGIAPHPNHEIPDAVYSAINSVQNTRWAINKRLLAVAKEAVERNLDEVLPVPTERELPPEVSGDAWGDMTEAEKSEIKLARRLVHEHNNRLDSKRQLVQRQLAVADKFAEYEFIAFPHNLDFRGRAYPLAQDLHPQSDDFGKAMLWFADGKPIDDRGFAWLQYQVASCYGMDKVSRDQQLDWVNANADIIRGVVEDPFDPEYLSWWSKADEPWQFMAAAQELIACLDHGEGYISRLPVSVDGSCNGLQHLSAMGRDAVGAQAVNLMPGPRQDIYGEVATKVARMVPEGSPWKGKVSRAVVKRGVMTKPYGLTHVGMRDQLIHDRPKTWDHVPGDVRENATHMRNWMAAAINETVLAAVNIMDWMQECASIMADLDEGLTWTTPTGYRVTQRYPLVKSRRFTICGVIMNQTNRTRVFHEVIPGIRKSKQVWAIAPNIVHSLDASHMMLSINKAVDEGLDAFAAVHDSFGVHAADMDRFLEIIKDTFVSIYSQPVLHDLYVEFQRQAPEGVVIPEPPELGDFDIELVRQSEFFFA